MLCKRRYLEASELITNHYYLECKRKCLAWKNKAQSARVQGQIVDRSGIDQVNQKWIAGKALQWYLAKGKSQIKSSNDVCLRVDCEQSPVMMFAQGWIANKVLRWCLPKGRLRAKSCNNIWPRVDCEQSPAIIFGQGWIASKVLQ